MRPFRKADYMIRHVNHEWDFHNAEEEIKLKLKQIHELNPEYIIIAQTAVTGWGNIIKEGLKKAYPEEKLPHFLFMDPRLCKHDTYAEKTGNYRYGSRSSVIPRMKQKKKIIKFISEHSSDPSNARILLLDDPSSMVDTKDKPEKMGICKGSSQSLYLLADDLCDWIVFPETEEAKRKNIRFKDVWSLGICFAIRSVYHRKGDIPTLEGRSKNFEERTLPGGYDIVRPYKGKEGLNYLAGLKQFGREVGEELRAEQQAKQKGLEGTLGIISLGGFLSSLLFLSSNFTGNAISNLTLKTANIIGVVLFLFGLVGAFFYFKKRK